MKNVTSLLILREVLYKIHMTVTHITVTWSNGKPGKGIYVIRERESNTKNDRMCILADR